MASRLSKRDKWERWFGEIRNQIYSAMESHLVYTEVSQIINANAVVARGGVFVERLSLWYADHIIMAIRRQAKIDKQSVSLARLITEIGESPHLVGREHWRELMRGYAVESLADSMFDRLAGAGEAHMKSAAISADLAQLAAMVKKCEAWADKRVAHHDKRRAPKAPTHDEVKAALDAQGKMLQKYHVLVTGDAIAFTTPEIQYNWKAVFDISWR